jgi:hypothetical protein
MNRVLWPGAIRMAVHLTAQACIGLLLFMIAAPSSAWAARHALIVGNNAYPGSELRNAVNDARDMAAALKEAGFEVLLRENATRDVLFQAIREFGAKLRDGDVALFYFAGHAIQLRDRNYLIPVDAKIRSEDDVTFYSLDITEVLSRVDRLRTRANVLILDACRDNPFASTVRFSSVGLAQMNAPGGTLIAYSTAPGQVAREGSGRNGVYTKHLLRHIGNPGQPVELVLKRVRDAVMTETRGEQIPWDVSSLRNELIIASNTLAAAPATATPSAEMRLAIEKSFWDSIKDSRDPKEFEAYIEQFPEGVFTSLARNRVRQTQAALDAAAVRPSSATSSISSAPGASTLAAPAPAGLPLASAPPATATADTRIVPTTRPGPGATLILPDGSRYEGTTLQGRLHGRGRLSSHTQGDYLGDFVMGRREGQGEIRWPNGDTFSGSFVADRPSGKGIMKFANGDRYEGGFDAGALSGQGSFSTPAGFVYEGSFVAGRRHGFGKATFANGNRYQGEFADNIVQGTGRMSFPDGGRYEGRFAAGAPNGAGTYFFPDGGRFTGDFKDGLMWGQGVHTFANGDRHEGRFVAGFPEGPGVRTFSSGERFEGTFSNRGRNASGTMIEQDGKRRPTRMEDTQFRHIDG